MKKILFWILVCLFVYLVFFCFLKKSYEKQEIQPKFNIFEDTKTIMYNPKSPVQIKNVNYFDEGMKNLRETYNGMRAFTCFKESIEYERNPMAVLMIAELYSQGVHGSVSPNKIVAARIYKTIQENSEKFPESIVQIAQQKYDSLLIYSNTHDTDYSAATDFLPQDFPFELARLLTHFGNINTTQRERTSPFLHPIVPDLDFHATQVAPMLLRQEQENQHVPEQIEYIAFEEFVVNNDTQNVHSSSVINCTDLILKDIEGTVRYPLSFEEARDTMLDFAFTLNNVDISKINNVINALNNDAHARFQRSDRQVFALVVSKITQDPKYSKEMKNNLMEILAIQIESAIERNQIVCNTGRIVRMLSVFDGVDNSQQRVIPEWVLDQELANLAIKIRDSSLKDASQELLNEYNDPAVENSKLREQMLKSFETQTMKDYSKIFSEDLLKKKLEVYSLGF